MNSETLALHHTGVGYVYRILHSNRGATHFECRICREIHPVETDDDLVIPLYPEDCVLGLDPKKELDAGVTRWFKILMS